MDRSAILTISLCLSLAASACAARGATTNHPLPAIDPGTLFDERLGVDDVFEVRAAGEEDLSGNYRVGADGTIYYPYVGRVEVRGMRPGEVQETLTERLKDGYFRNPQISVIVVEWNSRKINVLGQVQKPGPVPYVPQMTILDAITAAGGFTAIAAQNSVRLRREINGKAESYDYPLAEITEGRSPNVVLLPGDTVWVNERIF